MVFFEIFLSKTWKERQELLKHSFLQLLSACLLLHTAVRVSVYYPTECLVSSNFVEVCVKAENESKHGNV